MQLEEVIKVVCGVIFDEEGRVFACQRPCGDIRAGKWEFPGGKIEPGESHECALLREIDEELGCQVKVVRPLPEVVHAYEEITIRLLPFECKLIAGTPQALEHQAIGWLHYAEACQLDWAEADRPVVMNLRELTNQPDFP